MNEKIKIFISYGVTNANREIPDLISSDFRRLVNLWGATNIEITFDRDFLRGGDKWDTKIKQELESSNVIFFLINEKFLSSEYIANVEFKNTLTRDNIIILHAKLFQCEDYEQLNHIQAINLCNLPFFDFKEDEYRDSSRNRFEISKIASCLFSEVITNFPIAPPPNIILLSSAEIIKQKVNRKEELSDFEFITNRANSPNCSLFIYSATKHDIPNNFIPPQYVTLLGYKTAFLKEK